MRPRDVSERKRQVHLHVRPRKNRPHAQRPPQQRRRRLISRHVRAILIFNTENLKRHHRRYFALPRTRSHGACMHNDAAYRRPVPPGLFRAAVNRDGTRVGGGGGGGSVLGPVTYLVCISLVDCSSLRFSSFVVCLCAEDGRTGGRPRTTQTHRCAED